jgi:hypothetical protein
VAVEADGVADVALRLGADGRDREQDEQTGEG